MLADACKQGRRIIQAALCMGREGRKGWMGLKGQHEVAQL